MLKLHGHTLLTKDRVTVKFEHVTLSRSRVMLNGVFEQSEPSQMCNKPSTVHLHAAETAVLESRQFFPTPI